MGAYDEYDGIQIKAGACEMKNYKIGDECDLPDGIYLAYEGVIVISSGIFVDKFESVAEAKKDPRIIQALKTHDDQYGLKIYDKWGGEVESLDTDINGNNPVVQAIKDFNCNNTPQSGSGTVIPDNNFNPPHS